MKKSIALVAMMVITTSLSICTGKAESTSQQEITTSLTYPIVDTNQGTCYNNSELIDGPAEDEAFYEQNSKTYCDSLSLTAHDDCVHPV